MVERDSLSIRLLRVVFRIYHNISARKMLVAFNSSTAN